MDLSNQESLDLFEKVAYHRASKEPRPFSHPLFPHLGAQQTIAFTQSSSSRESPPIRVGLFFSGGTASGGHNVVIGLYKAMSKLSSNFSLIGFLNGPGGFLRGEYRSIEEDLLDSYLDTGGFDLLGSDRTKIESAEQFEQAVKVVQSLDLQGLVVIGGDDSNTNAALLANHFSSVGCSCNVIGVPKTIDGDLQSEEIEISFGFDTACKTYSQLIGNIARDALSIKKYWHFIRLMGRSASHIALECALLTQPNIALIGEEIAKEGKTLQDVVDLLVETITQRANMGKNYGVIVIPEGILEFIVDCKALIHELNGTKDPRSLSQESSQLFCSFPLQIQQQLLLDRDPHGNVQVSKIEFERLLISLVEAKLSPTVEFNPQPHFLGYEGRAAFPSRFDASYSLALGCSAALLLQERVSGYICFVRQLSLPPSRWQMGGVPLTRLIHCEKRGGRSRPVIKKSLVKIEAAIFQSFKRAREEWVLKDCYLFPHPCQLFSSSDSPFIVRQHLQSSTWE